MKILLTGSNGFLGKNLSKKLCEKFGEENIFLFKSHAFDLRKQSDCESLFSHSDPDVVIHAAGTVGGIGANKENPGRFMYENLTMGTNVIYESMCRNVKKFILLGTVCSYPKFTEVPFKEDDFWKGYPEETNAPYGIAKKALIELLSSYHKQYGFNSTSLVPANMYGPEDHFNLTTSHVIPAIILKIHYAIKNDEKEITIWGTGEASREFLYVDDCVEAIIKAIKIDTGPGPINIGTGKEIKIREVVEKIARIMGYSGDIIYDSNYPDGQPRRSLDVSLAKRFFDFEAKTSLNDGLKNTIDWFLSNGDIK